MTRLGAFKTCNVRSGSHNQIISRFRIQYLLPLLLLLSLWLTYELLPLEVLWSFSLYLEAVAILPQACLSYKARDRDAKVVTFVAAMFAYRGCYVANWITKYFYVGKR